MSDCGGDDYGGGDSGGGDYGGGDVEMTTFDSDYPAETSYSSPDPPEESNNEMTYFESSAPADEPSYSYEKNESFGTVDETNVTQVDVFLDDTENYTASRTYCTPTRTYCSSSRTYYTPSRTHYTHTSNNYNVSRGATYNDSDDCCEDMLSGSFSKVVIFIAAVLFGLLIIFLVLKKG